MAWHGAWHGAQEGEVLGVRCFWFEDFLVYWFVVSGGWYIALFDSFHVFDVFRFFVVSVVVFFGGDTFVWLCLFISCLFGGLFSFLLASSGIF